MRAKDIIAIFFGKSRPILAYVVKVWHPGFTMEQAKAIEGIQKRAYSIALHGVGYDCALEERRVELCINPVRKNSKSKRQNIQNSGPNTGEYK